MSRINPGDLVTFEGKATDYLAQKNAPDREHEGKRGRVVSDVLVSHGSGPSGTIFEVDFGGHYNPWIHTQDLRR